MSPPARGVIFEVGGTRRSATTGTLPTSESAYATGRYLSDTCWRTCQLSTLIPITVELMSPVVYTQEAYATCNVYRHRRPIILATSYLPTYPSSSSTALPYGTGTSTEAPSGHRRLLAAYLRTNFSNASGEHFGSALNHTRFRRFPILISSTGARPRVAQMSASRQLVEVPGTYLRTYPILYLL